MGIFCQINLCKPPDGAFHTGEIVSGMIKYAIDEPTEFEKITTSLKGIGQIRIRERTGSNNKRRHYTKSEVYIDTDEIIKEGRSTVPAGSYECKFCFRLPEFLPPSFELNKTIPKFGVECRIRYYIRIKFEKPGWFSFFAKHFRKEITVISSITPKLLMEPVIYGERRTLTQFFKTKTSTVIIKANIKNSVIPTAGKIELQYEVTNDTNIVIKSVETKLMEIYSFKASGHKEVKAFEDIADTDLKTGFIKAGESRTMPVVISVPSDKVSFDSSKIVSRDYIVRITAVLPLPHKNVLLDIPIQIGDKIQREEVCAPPPSYWEAMGEEKKEEDSDDEPDEKKEKGESS